MGRKRRRGLAAAGLRAASFATSIALAGAIVQNWSRPTLQDSTSALDAPATELDAAVVDDEAGALEGLGPATAPAWVPSRRDMLFRALLEADAGPLAPERHDLLALGYTAMSPIEADIAEWDRLADDAAATWDEVSNFLLRRPDWPQGSALRRRAERLMPETTGTAERLEWFAIHPPSTARGARLFGEALIAAGDVAEGEAIIVSAWSDRPSTSAEEALFLEAHGPLVADLHLTRFETMAFAGHDQSARRAAGRLDDGAAAYAAAITGLLSRRRGVDALVEAVPEEFASRPLLACARMRWRMRRERYSGAEEIFTEIDAPILAADDSIAAAEAALGAPSAWAAARMRLARDAHEDGRSSDAYALAAAHGLRSGRLFAELEWYAGWLALRFTGDPAAARVHFERLHAGVVTPISRGRAAYWAARAAEAMGDDDGAATWYAVAAETPGVFYGQLAVEALGDAPTYHDPNDARVFNRSAAEIAAAFDGADGELAEAAVLLTRAGRGADARRFLRALAERQSEPAEFAAAAWLARRLGDPWAEIRVAQAAESEGVDLWSALYPTPAFMDLRDRRVEPALLLAVARVESRFSPSARSGAGAQGLMQMLASTARASARRIGVDWSPERLNGDADYNLTLGDAHLETLLAFWDGSYVLAIASYNAGEGNVLRWIDRFGDPRDPGVDVVDWIETIPFSETRNYVQRVLEGVAVYRIRLDGGRGALQPTADLTR